MSENHEVSTSENSRKRRQSHAVSVTEVEMPLIPHEATSIGGGENDNGALVASDKVHSLPELSEDIMFQILSRLPVEPVFRFQCVCKLWKQHLSSPIFAEKHHLSPYQPCDTFAIVSLSSGSFFLRELTAPNACATLRYLRLNSVDGGPKQLACSHGMVCYRTEDENKDIFVCNPVTQEFIVLPYIEDYEFEIQGLYFNRLNYSFKVLVWCWPTGSIRRGLWMFSSETERWKRISLGMQVFIYGGRFICVGSVLYQLGEHAVYTFDMEREEWGSIRVPPGVSGKSCCMMEWDGRVCLVQEPKRFELVIWRLSETIWEKGTTLCLEKRFYRRGSYPHVRDLGIVGHRGCLFVARVVRRTVEVTSYDIDGNKRDIKWRFCSNDKLNEDFSLKIFPFTPTLLQFRTITATHVQTSS
ncbi:hypothetical protein AMTRI_Chr08g168330 [Amborella trichopoda]|uniref:F-box domain-containing protein n=1 Tax=Amborella trichopoda TaxID=13333 RepID=W1P9E0_AMBTC|nr:F-box protein At2g23160 [Amborella trichopoda]ERN04206.1 hypothetical protein AMTR_s00077p00120590 [Amborella trichopoda]|eukprot:XP_006842531.1 F-box protein At2g23160 [Amborella trichopoda]